MSQDSAESVRVTVANALVGLLPYPARPPIEYNFPSTYSVQCIALLRFIFAILRHLKDSSVTFESNMKQELLNAVFTNNLSIIESVSATTSGNGNKELSGSDPGGFPEDPPPAPPNEPPFSDPSPLGGGLPGGRLVPVLLDPDPVSGWSGDDTATLEPPMYIRSTPTTRCLKIVPLLS